jgi:hypothetical protein
MTPSAKTDQVPKFVRAAVRPVNDVVDVVDVSPPASFAERRVLLADLPRLAVHLDVWFHNSIMPLQLGYK